jgi:hypothetical protein
MDFIAIYDIRFKNELHKDKYPSLKVMPYKCPVRIWNKNAKRIFMDDSEIYKIYEQI